MMGAPTWEFSAPSRLPISKRAVCQGWRCTGRAIWARWAGLYCYDHAIRAGWIAGPAVMPGTQMRLCA